MPVQSDIEFEITPQPDELSCGPSCLHAVYRHWDDALALDRLFTEVPRLKLGGTLAVFLGLHALQRGYDATIYTCNLHQFDPTWFQDERTDLAERLRTQMQAKDDPKLRVASEAYIDFLGQGGVVKMSEITADIFESAIARRLPVIAGLSATWLYQCARERTSDMKPDDILGEPTGHFVVVNGIDTRAGMIHVADPYLQRPFPGSHYYSVSIERFIAAVLLGIVTYDAKLLILQPRD